MGTKIPASLGFFDRPYQTHLRWEVIWQFLVSASINWSLKIREHEETSSPLRSRWKWSSPTWTKRKYLLLLNSPRWVSFSSKHQIDSYVYFTDYEGLYNTTTWICFVDVKGWAQSWQDSDATHIVWCWHHSAPGFFHCIWLYTLPQRTEPMLQGKLQIFKDPIVLYYCS